MDIVVDSYYNDYVVYVLIYKKGFCVWCNKFNICNVLLIVIFMSLFLFFYVILYLIWDIVK